MKKILLILGLTLFTIFAYSQKPKAEVVRYTEVTTAQKNAFVVPAGEHWNVYDITLQRFEFWDGDSWEPRDTGGGETNTVSSQGTGTTIFYQKSGVDLQFNAIKSENNLLTVSLDGTTHDVELTVNQGNISITASQVSDFDVEVSNNPAVVLNTDKETNATHTGEVTGATGLTLDATAISNKTLDIALLGTEHVLIDDSGLKKTTLQAIADLSGVGINGILQKNLSWGESYINNWRDLVLDDGATYFPNNGGYEKGRLHQLGLIPSLHFIPAAVKEAVLYSIGKNRTNDFDVDRAAFATYIDEDRIIQTADYHVARIDYTDGDGAILAEPQSTNLIERSETFGHNYWTKSDATIEGDASTAGSELVTSWTNLDYATFTSSGTDITSAITNGVAQNCYSNLLTLEEGKLYMFKVTIAGTAGATLRARVSLNTSLNGAFVSSPILTVGENEVYLYSNTSSNVVYIGFRNEADDGNWSATNFEFKEVTGFSAPDGTTNAFKLVASSNNGFIQLASSETISNATSYTNSIFIKRAVGTGNILIKDINNAETNVSTLIGVELADSWTRYDITDTSSSTSGQIGVKLATSGDEVYIFGADLKEDLGSSYIKSDSGSSTTRLKDVISGAGDSNTFNSVSGSFKVNIRALSNDLTVRTISINDGTASNAITIGYNNASNTILAEYIISGSPVASLSYQVSDITEYHDVEFQYALNDFKLLIDDVERDTDVSGAVLSAGTLNSLDYHNGGSSNSFFGKQKQLIIQK